MKKLILFYLAVVLLAGLISCDGSVNDELFNTKCTVRLYCTAAGQRLTFEDLLGEDTYYYDEMLSSQITGQYAEYKVKKGEIFNPAFYYFDPEENVTCCMTLQMLSQNNPMLKLLDSNLEDYSNKPITSDIDLYMDVGGCIAPGSILTMADGSKKAVDNVQLGEELLTWDFYQGKLVANRIIAYEKLDPEKHVRIAIATDNGNEISIIDAQAFFDTDKKEYFNISLLNYSSAVGKNILVTDGTAVRSEKITNIQAETVEVACYDIITESAFNFFSDNILTVYPGLLSITPYTVDEKYKYDPVLMAADRAKYGLLEYNGFEEIGSEEAFRMLRMEEVQILLGKGYVTEDFVKYAVNSFKKTTEGVR